MVCVGNIFQQKMLIRNIVLPNLYIFTKTK